MSEEFHIMRTPYADRQLIVVTDDALVEATKKEERKAFSEQPQGVDWMRIAEAAVLDVIKIPFSRLATEVAREALRAWGRAKEEGVQVLPIGKTAARELTFPPGHPRDGILYIGHPTLPSVYYTMAEFHRVVFEHKFCEAVELLMSLGATKIRVEHIRGWSKDFSARISIPLSAANVSIGAEAEGGIASKSHLLYEATLSGSSTPKILEDAVWYPHEPTWQSIAKGRLNYGLTNFSLSVSYEDDFGVNAGLKMTAQKAGLDLGGKFEDHQSTVWHLDGEFNAPELGL